MASTVSTMESQLTQHSHDTWIVWTVVVTIVHTTTNHRRHISQHLIILSFHQRPSQSTMGLSLLAASDVFVARLGCAVM